MPRRADVPCAGGCGKLLWRGPTSLLPGLMTCNACRSERHGGHRRYLGGCRCEECRAGEAAMQRRFRVAYKTKTGDPYRPPTRPIGTPRDCEVCGAPLGFAHPTAVWHVECRPKFYARPERRLAIYERDDWMCQLCGVAVDASLSSRDPWSATLDHIVPRSLGGTNESTNLRLAHRSCNSARGNRVEGDVA